MALKDIQMPGWKPRGPNLMEQINLGMQIANNALGTALAVPKYLMEKKEFGMKEAEHKAKMDLVPWEKAKLQGGLLGTVEQVPEGETGGLEFPKEIGMPGKWRSKTEEPWSATDKGINEGLKTLAAQDIGIIPMKNPQGINVPQRIKLSKATPEQLRQVIKNAGEYRVTLGENLSGARAEGVNINLQGLVERQEQNQKTQFKAVRDRINSIVDPLEKDLDNMRTAERSVDTGTQIGANVAGTFIAKVVGKDAGELSEGDIVRYIPRSMWGYAGKIANWLKGTPDVYLTGPEQEAMKLVLKSAAKETRRNLATRVFNEMERQTAGDPEFFSDPNVKKYLSTLERQIPGVKKAQKLSELQDAIEIEADPTVRAKLESTKQAIEDNF